MIWNYRTCKCEKIDFLPWNLRNYRRNALEIRDFLPWGKIIAHPDAEMPNFYRGFSKG